MKDKDFDRFVAACDYPGEIKPEEVESHLSEYLSALGLKRNIVQIKAGWNVDDYPHQEHNPIDISPGIRWIVIEQEYTPGRIQRTVD